jgi:hypothetical protein
MKKSRLLAAALMVLFSVMEAQTDYLLGSVTEPKPSIATLDSSAVRLPMPAGSFSFEPKASRKIPQKGINGGLSQHEIWLTSLNFGYLSGQKIGFDASVRAYYYHSSRELWVTSFVGPVYQIGDSRFFAKTGLEFIFEPENEFGEKLIVIFGFLGSKYLLPFSKSIGLHVEAGSYFTFYESRIELLPAFGLGIIFCPFGPKSP